MPSDLDKHPVEDAKERRKQYLRRYAAAQRAGTLPARSVGSGGSEPSYSTKTAQAAYVPARDGVLRHDSLTAVLMGDPPVGRRALDKAPGER